ncbi:MAG: hypothetical protein V2J51_01030 [Erythrobacter sp.]|nr:hypothetical protein [Erythrobacter sp.]
MIYILLNVVPIALAMIAGLAIGLVWLRLSSMLLPGWRTLAVAGLAQFWLASILAGALILAPDEAGAWIMALGSAFVIWVGFVMPTLMVTFVVYEVRTRSAWSAAIYWLVAMVTMAVIMQAWGLSAPPGT